MKKMSKDTDLREIHIKQQQNILNKENEDHGHPSVSFYPLFCHPD